MRSDKGRTFIYFLVIAAIAFALHKAASQYIFTGIKQGYGIYSLETLYLFFSAASLIVLVLVSIIDKKNHDQTGMSFLLITSIKMAGCYVLVRPLLSGGTSYEKANFLFLFILFLSIETILTIRILNKKQ